MDRPGAQPILALDLSLKTGWALGCFGEVAKHGVWLLPREGASLGERLSAMDNILADGLAVMQPRLVIFESPLARQQTSARILLGLACIVEKVCHELHFRCVEAHSQEARKLVLGKGRFSEIQGGKRVSTNKSVVCAWARAGGYSPYDDNDADALLLLHYAHEMERVAHETRRR